MIIVNNRQVKGMYYNKRSTSPMLLNLDEEDYAYISSINMRAGDLSPDDFSYPVKRAYYNGHLVYEKITPTIPPTEPPISADTRARIEITSDVDLTSNGSMYIKVNETKIQATETKTDSLGRTVYVYPITSNITTLAHFMDSENGLGYNNNSTCNFWLVEFINCDDKIISSSTFSLQSAFVNPRIHEIKGINWNLKTIKTAENCFLRCNMLRGILNISNWELNCPTNGWFAITTATHTYETLTVYADNLKSTTWKDWGYSYGKYIVIYCTQATKTAMSSLYPSKNNIVYKVLPAEDDRFISRQLKTFEIELTKYIVNYNITKVTKIITITYSAKMPSGTTIEQVETLNVESDDFGINNSGQDRNITISHTIEGMTKSVILTQLSEENSPKQFYVLDLHDGAWIKSNTVSNPNSLLYDGVYMSAKNKGVNNSGDLLTITINGYSSFTLYIRSYAESNYDYVMVSQLDQKIAYNTSYSNTTLIKEHTRGKQNSGTAISNYTKVTFDNIDGGEHNINVIYRKDSSTNSNDDRGYLLIPFDQ